MQRHGTFAVLAALVLVFNVGWGRPKQTFELDKAKLAAVKRVAVFSVYSPGRHSEGFREKVDLQPFSNSAERMIVDGLTKAGFDVVPLEETKAAFQAQFGNAFATAAGSKLRRGDRERFEEFVRNSGLQHQRHGITGAKASRNTSFVFGTDEPEWIWRLTYTLDGHPLLDDDAKVDHADAAIRALATIAASLNADGFVIARLRPTTAGTTGNNKSGWRNVSRAFNPVAAIRDSVKTMKTGEYGANILDFDLFDRQANSVFSDQVIERSEKEVGNLATGFKVVHGIGSAAVPLMKEALDKSIVTTFRHLTGGELAALDGMGVEALEESPGVQATVDPASIPGSYVLERIGHDKPLPHTVPEKMTYLGGSLVLSPDGTFVSTTEYQNGGSARSSTVKGTYTTEARLLLFKNEGGLVARMFAPNKGEVGEGTLTLYPGGFVYRRQ